MIAQCGLVGFRTSSIIQIMNLICELCTTIHSPETVLYEGLHWFVFLAPDQGYPGRCYVTLKRHKAHLHELSKDEWADYSDIVVRLETACQQALGSTLFNWSCLMNNAYQKKPCVPHVHWHFRPRYENPIKIGDKIFKDKDFGFHYDRQHKIVVSDVVYSEIFQRVRARIIDPVR
jgi:diadenosine tetraphosphate (Ap4A) HIT family hydrolase